MSTPISLGIDLGTSELKAILLDSDGVIQGHASAPVQSHYPKPGWSEQNPEDWWSACVAALKELRTRYPEAWRQVSCIGLSGQMHGVVALDAQDRPVRPAIIWNDSRATEQATALAGRFPQAADVLGSVPMAGFTAPKVLWIKENEPAVFNAIHCVLSPKDFLRLRLTGVKVTDTSDAAGTLWMNEPNRCWYEPMVEATGLKLRQLPDIVEGTGATGQVTSAAADVLGLGTSVIVAGGAGDNPASAVAIAAGASDGAFITLGTSAAVVALTRSPVPRVTHGIHGFAHTLPGQWYAMGAILSGASCLRWATKLLGEASELAFLEKIAESVPLSEPPPRDAPIFLPYIAGERTPHNDPLLRGGFMKLGVETSRGQLGYSVLEGVAFALRDAMVAVEASGVPVGKCALVGGGAKSDYWAQLLANVLDRELYTLQGSELAAGMGAAMLGFAAASDGRLSFERPLPVKATFIPQRTFAAVYDDRYRQFQSLLPAAAGVRVESAGR